MEILRLLPDQVMDHWHFIRDAIIQAFPPVANATAETFLEIQEQFLIGTMDCWFGVEGLNAQDILAVMTTKVVFEEVTKTKNMLIFSVTTYAPHSEALWVKGYDTLRRYAASKGCSKIISFTNNAQVIRIANDLGADVSWYLIQLDV